MRDQTLGRCLVVVPAYLAENTIASLVNRIRAQGPLRILVIDDCSNDRTASIARECGIDVISHPVNRGYGGAQKTAYAEALRSDCDYVAMIHGDLQYAPEALPDLLAPLIEGKSDVCLGSRILGGDPLGEGMPPVRWLSNRLLTAFQNFRYKVDLTDFHTGYRVYRLAVLRNLPFLEFSEDFRFDAQMMDVLLRTGIRVSEMPIPTSYGPGARSIGYRDAVVYTAEVLKLAFRSHG